MRTTALVGPFVHRLVSRHRRLVACGVALACLAAGLGISGVRARARAAVHRLQTGRATSATDAQATTPEYVADLRGQLGQIGVIVREELVTRKGATDAQAEAAVDTFLGGLGGVVKAPLTEEQFGAITSSLERRRFSWMDSYPDITALEVQYHSLVWADFVRLYLEREAAGPSNQAVVAQQVDELVATAQAAMAAGFEGRSESSQVQEMTHYFRDLLTRDMQDPVLPALKRPFTADELATLKTWASTHLAQAIKRWLASKAYAPDHASIAVASTLNGVWDQVWRLQYTAPKLSPDRMEQMAKERDALITQRAKEFDSLPEPQKQQAYQQRLRREREEGQ